MTIAIRSAADVAKKWQEVTPQRAPIYEAGVKNPLRNWEEETLEAKERQKEGMRKAIQEDRIAKGVARVGNAKWQRNTVMKGPGRWSEGVRMAEADYLSGWAPYREVIANLTLPEKYAAGDPRNWERSKAVGLALHLKKTQG